MYFRMYIGKYFSECKTGSSEFDECIMNAINNVSSYFITGNILFIYFALVHLYNNLYLIYLGDF